MLKALMISQRWLDLPSQVVTQQAVTPPVQGIRHLLRLGRDRGR